MINKGKLFIGGLLTMTMILSSAVTCFADNNVVSKTQDNITVTKTAEWTTVDGKSEDSNGNRYAKINFKIDTTNATTETISTISKGGDTDIMLVLDASGSMASRSKSTKMKTAAKSFVEEVLAIQDVKVNVGVIQFESGTKVMSELKNDKTALHNAIDSVKASGGTTLAPAIRKSTDMLATSQAKNKFMIILTDGEVYDEGASQTAVTNAFTTIPNLKTITIGYDTGAKAETFLKGIATQTSTGSMFYTADVQTSGIVSDLKAVFEQITEQVTQYVVGNSLVDTIPTQFSILDGTITTNDQTLKAEISEDKHSINWNWGENKLEKKVYEMSVITVLDKNQVPAGCKEVFTNGTTIDTTADSSQSAVFSYGTTNKMYLNSPILSLVEEEVKVPAEEAPKADAPDAGMTDDTPATGDSLNYMVFVVAGLAGVICVATATKKRKSF